MASIISYHDYNFSAGISQYDTASGEGHTALGILQSILLASEDPTYSYNGCVPLHMPEQSATYDNVVYIPVVAEEEISGSSVTYYTDHYIFGVGVDIAHDGTGESVNIKFSARVRLINAGKKSPESGIAAIGFFHNTETPEGENEYLLHSREGWKNIAIICSCALSASSPDVFSFLVRRGDTDLSQFLVIDSWGVELL